MNRTAICLITNNRPEYFSQCIDYLIKSNNIEKYNIVTGENPPSTNLDECFNKLSQYCNVNRNINRELRGIVRNVKGVLDVAFLTYNNIILIEEDVIVSRDALEFCDNMLYKFRNDKNCLSISLFENNIVKQKLSNYNKYKKKNRFHSLGIAMWKDRWDKISDIYYDIETQDGSGDVNINPHNWDTRLEQYRQDNNMYIINPIVSRCSHIAYDGVNASNYSHEWLDENATSPYWFGDSELIINKWEEQIIES